MNIVLAIALFILYGFDAFVTKRRIHRYGLNVELNKVIRFLSKKFNPEVGALIGIMIPVTCFIYVCFQFHLETLLALMVGFRLHSSFIQAESLIFEKEIRDFAAKLNADKDGPVPPKSLPVAPPNESSQSESDLPSSRDK